MKYLVAISILTFLSFKSYTQHLSSTVLNAADEKPLEFVSIGIKGQDVGTLTDAGGRFNLMIPAATKYEGDTLKISHLGFKTREFILGPGRLLPEKILLEAEVISLDVVNIDSKSSQKLVSKGNVSSSSRIITGWNGRVGTGAERGTKISIGKKRAFIEKVRFYIAENKYDSVMFRLHIRTLKENLPHNNILDVNVFTTARSGNCWTVFDLSEFNRSLTGDIAISVEVIKTWGNYSGSDYLYLSASMLRGILYAKDGANGKWYRKKRFSPSIVADLNYID